jgi:hypothetical protein
MRSHRGLVALSGAQLVSGVAGHLIAVRDGRPVNAALLGQRGRADRVARDAWLHGTGLSAPVVMLGAQAVLTARLARRPSRRTARILGLLGTAMACGYLVEQDFRDAFTRGGWDRQVTPVATAAFVLSLSMAAAGIA